MKVCPQCQTKYTDDTLKFCLQDGKPLKHPVDDKTLAFDQDSFANEQTVVDNYSGETEDFAGETVAFKNDETNSNRQRTIEPKYDIRHSQETIAKPRGFAQMPPPGSTQTPAKSGGFGVLTGLVIAILLIGLIGAGIVAVVYLPTLFGDNTNEITNKSNNTNDTSKERTLSDTDEVKVTSSSTRKPDKGNLYDPSLAFDGNSRTAWCEGAKGAGIGQWIVFDFKEEVKLKKIIIEPGYFKTNELWQQNNRLKRANLKFSDGTTKSVNFPNEMQMQIINTENIETKSVMVTIKEIYGGRTDSKDTLVSEVKFVVE